MIVAGILLFMKYSDKEASRDFDQWNDNQKAGNPETREYELKEYQQVKELAD